MKRVPAVQKHLCDTAATGMCPYVSVFFTGQLSWDLA